MKKIRPNHKLTIIFFIILFFAIAFVCWGIFGFKPWRINETSYSHNFIAEAIYIPLSFLISGLGLFWYIKRLYYLIFDNRIEVHSGKVTEYWFKDIIYIDEEYTKKHVDAKMYVKDKGIVNLTLDKEKTILDLLHKKCKLISKERLLERYPDLKI